MTDTTMTDAERLELLEQQLAKLQSAQQAEQSTERARREILSRPPGPEANGTASLGKARERIQQARIAAGNEAMAERQRQYDDQLARNAPEMEKIEGEIRDLDGQVGAARAKYDIAVAKLADKRKSLRAKLDELQEMPELPAIEPAYDPKDIDLVLNFGRPAGSPRVTPDDVKVVGTYWQGGHQQVITAEQQRLQREKAAQ